jgi:hypothetical protein
MEEAGVVFDDGIAPGPLVEEMRYVIKRKHAEQRDKRAQYFLMVVEEGQFRIGDREAGTKEIRYGTILPAVGRCRRDRENQSMFRIRWVTEEEVHTGAVVFKKEEVAHIVLKAFRMARGEPETTEPLHEGQGGGR